MVQIQELRNTSVPAMLCDILIFWIHTCVILCIEHTHPVAYFAAWQTLQAEMTQNWGIILSLLLLHVITMIIMIIVIVTIIMVTYSLLLSLSIIINMILHVYTYITYTQYIYIYNHSNETVLTQISFSLPPPLHLRSASRELSSMENDFSFRGWCNLLISEFHGTSPI